MGVGITYSGWVLILQPSGGVKKEVRLSQGGGEEVKKRAEKRKQRQKKKTKKTKTEEGGRVVVWVSVKKTILVLAVSKVFSLHSATLLSFLLKQLSKPSTLSLFLGFFHFL